jgi:hypothetical protein
VQALFHKGIDELSAGIQNKKSQQKRLSHFVGPLADVVLRSISTKEDQCRNALIRD